MIQNGVDAISQPSGALDSPQGRILVVDDDEKNRIILVDLLEVRGYLVKQAVDGEEALEATRTWSPDVVLLDIMMPKLDGFEVCRRIKTDPTLAQIPVIMITALAKRQERLMGIEAGANDFLVKPIDISDTLLRVANAVRTKLTFDKLRDSYERLRELETLRDNLVDMIAHDMRSPLTAILGYADLLGTTVGDSSVSQFVASIRSSTRRLTQMIDNLLDVSRLEANKMPLESMACDLAEIINSTVKNLEFAAHNRTCSIQLDSDSLRIEADPALLARIVENLLANALKFSPTGSQIEISARRASEMIRVEVKDHGPGVPAEARTRIFEKFGQVKATRNRNSCGLGLAFCKLAVSRHGGDIGVSDHPEGGSVFWFTLPNCKMD